MAGGANKGKMHPRTVDRVKLLIRLELANPMMNSSQLAELMGINIVRFSVLKRTSLYRQLHNQYMTGVLGKLDEKVDDGLTLTQDTLKFAVPIALQNLVKQALQEKDLRVQNKACNDILDRDGHFAKVSRIGLVTEEQGGVAQKKDNEVANELMKAIQQAQTLKSPTPTIEATPLTDTTQ